MTGTRLRGSSKRAGPGGGHGERRWGLGGGQRRTARGAAGAALLGPAALSRRLRQHRPGPAALAQASVVSYAGLRHGKRGIMNRKTRRWIFHIFLSLGIVYIKIG